MYNFPGDSHVCPSRVSVHHRRLGETHLKRLAVTGLVALATVLGTWGAVSAASAGTSSPASVSSVTPASAPVSVSFAKPGAPSVPNHLAYPAGMRPAVTAPFNVLQDVSCLNPNDCLAVGSNNTANGGHGSPIAYLWSKGSWHATAVPLPSGATGGFLASVSCKPGLCLAVGDYWRGTTSYLLAEYWKGAGWKNTPQPAAISGAKYSYLTIASCASSAFCVASGAYVPSSNTNQLVAVAEVWNGSSWRLSKPPAAGPYHYAGLFSVSCPAVNSCLLGGEYATADQGFFETLVERFDGAHWRQVTDGVATPTQGVASFVDSVSCASSTSCAIVGVVTPAVSTNSAVWHAFTETLSGTAWTIENNGLPTNSATTLNAVSCPTTTYCVAVGGLGTYAKATTGKAAYAIWTGGTTWALHYPALPSSDAGQGSILDGVQCLTATSCDAGGLAGAYNTNTSHGLTGFWNGTTWTTVNTA
jgi:hypothetical protein